jgi:DNA-binding response OmpR family regulator
MSGGKSSRSSVPRPKPKTEGPAIMMAEDDRGTRRLISYKLERTGFQVTVCGDGEELLARAAEAKPALFILDLMMPIKDGYTTLRALKSDPGLATVPVLMLSSKNQDEDVVRCLEAGAADYMAKPFSPDELVARVHKLLPRANPAPHR